MTLLFMFLFSVYFYSLDLTVENPFPPGTLYKNLDQDDLTSGLQKGSKVFTSSDFTKVRFFETCHLGQLSHIPLQISPPKQRALVLRC